MSAVGWEINSFIRLLLVEALHAILIASEFAEQFFLVSYFLNCVLWSCIGIVYTYPYLIIILIFLIKNVKKKGRVRHVADSCL